MDDDFHPYKNNVWFGKQAIKHGGQTLPDLPGFGFEFLDVSPKFPWVRCQSLRGVFDVLQLHLLVMFQVKGIKMHTLEIQPTILHMLVYGS